MSNRSILSVPQGNDKKPQLITRSCQIPGNYAILESENFMVALSNLHKKYGKLVSFTLGGKKFVSTIDPKYIKQTIKLTDRPLELFAKLEPIIGKSSIQLLNGDEWRRRREATNYTLSYYSLKYRSTSLFGIMENWVDERFDNGKDLNLVIQDEMGLLSFRFISFIAFGKSLSSQEGIDFIRYYQRIWAAIERNQFDQTNPEYEDLCNTITEMKRLCHLHIQPFLEKFYYCSDSELPVENAEKGETTWLEAWIRYARKENFNEDIIINDVITTLIAGYHTTGFLLTWFFYYVLLNPKVYKKIVEEIKSEFGLYSRENNPNPISIITVQDLAKLKYLSSTLNETLRHSGLGTLSARYSDQPIEFVSDPFSDANASGAGAGGANIEYQNSYSIEPYTPIIYFLFEMFQSKHYWNSPEKFNPDRFNLESSMKSPHLQNPLIYSPFGVGKRICPGMQLNQIESKLILCYIFYYYDVIPENLNELASIVPEDGLIIKPSKPFRGIFVPRE